MNPVIWCHNIQKPNKQNPALLLIAKRLAKATRSNKEILA